METETKEDTGDVTLADIMREGLNDYINQYGKLAPKQLSVVNHILQCRTPALGGHIYACNNCDYQAVHYNSCRDRHCPQCQGMAQAVWVQKRVDELLPVGYFHVVFTLPHELNGYALRHKELVYTILFKAVSETLQSLGRDPQWLGAMIGFIAVLHTWGQKLLDHIHLHCIIPGGGIRADGKKWLQARPNYLFPVEVMGSLFRGKFLDYFHQEISRLPFEQRGKAVEYSDAVALNSFIQQLRSKDWVVYAKEPFASAQQVLKYLGRYTNRVAISNKRFLSLENKTVGFLWRDYADENKQKEMSLPVVEFIRRYLLHVLPQGFVRIRYYGILSNGNKTERLTRCFELLEKKYRIRENATTIINQILQCLGIDIRQCPRCHRGRCSQSGVLIKVPYRMGVLGI